MFIIVKKSENQPTNFNVDHAYAGPACLSTGVEPANRYNSRKAAEVDAAYLERNTESKFAVVELV
jgi:hypothetical protein